MTFRTYTVSLSVLASMLEAGTINSVRFRLSGIHEQDDTSAHFRFTPEQLRNFVGDDNCLLCVREALWDWGGRDVIIGNGNRNFVTDFNWQPPQYDRAHHIRHVQ